MKSARSYALDVLLSVERDGRYPGPLLQRVARDKKVHFGLVQRLVKGTLQQQAAIDALLQPLCGAVFRKIPAQLKIILRLAAYQFVYLKEVPRKLVIVESLQLAKASRQFCSGLDMKSVLNALAEGGASLAPSAQPGDFAAQVRALGHPLWLAKKVADLLGESEALAFCAANNKPWPVVVRANSMRIKSKALLQSLRAGGVAVSPGSLLPECLVIRKLPARMRLTDLPEFKQGLMQVQDESAALVMHLLDPKPGELVIDMCAAPGGKATHAGSLMQDRGEVLALDIHASRVKLITQNCRRQGLHCVRAIIGDARSFCPPRPADRVVLDAPCSGFGTLGRKVDIRLQRSADSIKELTILQSELLEAAAGLVKPGGYLAYSTCTVLREENEDRVLEFLQAHPEFKLVAGNDRGLSALVTSEGMYRTWPHRHSVGGAFLAILRRSEG
ncbi:MAG: 16S rRNA (cytosine(967)-C(5))-methyltransferase RsmB [Oligoflexia bacterium]|nr:16S rRNA (cytosine(967)-C(5))-methyltransferase RsmB [Oligoflexia bacterium]